MNKDIIIIPGIDKYIIKFINEPYVVSKEFNIQELNDFIDKINKAMRLKEDTVL